MFRRSIILLVFAISIAAVGMFSLKHEVQSRKAKLDALHQDIVESQEAIRVLRAEWSFINQPAHIERLARKHLGFVPMQSHQIVRLEELEGIANRTDFEFLQTEPIFYYLRTPTNPRHSKYFQKIPNYFIQCVDIYQIYDIMYLV